MIDLMLNEEQAQIADSIAGVVAAEFPIRRLYSGTFDNDAGKWPLMAELGWFGLGLPEASGGVGYGIIEEMLLLRHTARRLVSPSLLASVLSVHVSEALGDKALCTALVAGEKRAALAYGGDPANEGRVVDAAGADVFLAWTDEALYLLDRSELDLVEKRSVDPSLSLHGYSARAGTARRCVDVALVTRAEFLAVAALAGIAEDTAARAAAHALEREQFGKPIGSFQAIKHICADMATRAEALTGQLTYAATMLDARTNSANQEVVAARTIARSYVPQNCEENIQVHGAIGFTSDFEAHFYLKRANLLNLAGADHRRLQEAFLAKLTA